MLTGLRAVRVILDAQHEPVRENPKNPYPERGRDSTRRPIRATGVVVRDAEGRELEFRALAEVILCCGAIDSPRLLQLSGIGPRHVLEAAGVPVLADVPGVGENLQDHAEGLVVWEASEAPPPVCASGWDAGAGDPGAVVDSQLRVHGVAGLRVADASVFPALTSVNPVVTVMVVAERAADLIWPPAE